MTHVRGPEPHPPYVGVPTYLNVPLALSTSELKELNADVAIMGAPVDMSVVNRPGARFGPRAIRQAAYFGSAHHEIYHAELDVYPLEVLKVVDFGDANCPPGSLERSHEAINSKVDEVLDAGAVPVVLGGDHSITLPSATAVSDHYGFGNVGIVHFDAHADTRDSSFGEVLIGHGSPMRRLIESGAVPGKNFVQVGLRGYYPDRELFAWMRDKGMRWHTMSEIEARGLSSSELLRAVRRVVAAVKPVALDVVEVSPPYDGPGAITAEVAHRIVLEAISGWARLRVDEQA